MDKKKLTFYTNIASPYNIDFFNSLSFYFDLNVYYFKKNEVERSWHLTKFAHSYRSNIFSEDLFHKILQKFNRNLYFNIDCIVNSINDTSNVYVLSGNYFAPNNILSLLILKLRKKKVYWFGESMLPTQNIFVNLFKHFLINFYNKMVNGVFAVGNKAVESYKKYGITKPIFNTPYSINSSNFINLQFVKSKKIIFLTSASLIKRKGIDLAIEAFNLLSFEESSKVEYWIIGEGPELSNLKKIIKPHIKVIFFGFIQPENINYYFNKANYFILTSRYDGWAVVINEALSAGLPIIVSNTCGAAEYITPQTGFIVNLEVSEIYNKILFFINNHHLHSNFSKNCIEFSKKINSNTIASNFYSIISSN
jgi:glycosyltransferase involved in cell wall biosynthesis